MRGSNLLVCLIIQEGQRPSQIISPKLDVGDNMQRNASNGNTGLYMNGREITKEEMWMLTVVKPGTIMFCYLSGFLNMLN